MKGEIMVKDVRHTRAARGDYRPDDRYDSGGPPWLLIATLGVCLFAGDAIVDGLIRWGWTILLWSIGVSLAVGLIGAWVWMWVDGDDDDWDDDWYYDGEYDDGEDD